MFFVKFKHPADAIASAVNTKYDINFIPKIGILYEVVVVQMVRVSLFVEEPLYKAYVWLGGDFGYFNSSDIEIFDSSHNNITNQVYSRLGICRVGKLSSPLKSSFRR